jgi:hypothetical protein
MDEGVEEGLKSVGLRGVLVETQWVKFIRFLFFV